MTIIINEILTPSVQPSRHPTDTVNGISGTLIGVKDTEYTHGTVYQFPSAEAALAELEAKDNRADANVPATGTILDALKQQQSEERGRVQISIGEYNADPATQKTNVNTALALLEDGIAGVYPDIVTVPGFTGTTASADATVTALASTLDKLWATGVVNPPKVASGLGHWENARLYAKANESDLIIMPYSRDGGPSGTNANDLSAAFAGMMARVDDETGRATNLSGERLLSVARLSDPLTRPGRNKANAILDSLTNRDATHGFICPLIEQGGVIVGEKGHEFSGDPGDAALINIGPRRVQQTVFYFLKDTFFDVTTGNVDANTFGNVSLRVNNFITNTLVPANQLHGGLCEADPIRNTPEGIAKGNLFFLVSLQYIGHVKSLTFTVQASPAGVYVVS